MEGEKESTRYELIEKEHRVVREENFDFFDDNNYCLSNTF